MSDNRNFLQLLEVLDNGDVLVRCWPMDALSAESLEALGEPQVEVVCPADQVLDVANFTEKRAVFLRDEEGE